MENKTWCNGSTRLTTEKAERDKDISEQQSNKKIRNNQSLVKEIGSLASKSADLSLVHPYIVFHVYTSTLKTEFLKIFTLEGVFKKVHFQWL